jgi:hypothetical protein
MSLTGWPSGCFLKCDERREEGGYGSQPSILKIR